MVDSLSTQCQCQSPSPRVHSSTSTPRGSRCRLRLRSRSTGLLRGWPLHWAWAEQWDRAAPAFFPVFLSTGSWQLVAHLGLVVWCVIVPNLYRLGSFPHRIYSFISSHLLASLLLLFLLLLSSSHLRTLPLCYFFHKRAVQLARRLPPTFTRYAALPFDPDRLAPPNLHFLLPIMSPASGIPVYWPS